MIGWQELARNEWLQEVRAALSVGRDLPAPPAGAPGPFGLADPDGVRTDLASAGFRDIALESIEAPFWVGTGEEDAFNFMRNTGAVRGMLEGLDDSARAAALLALRETMAAHETRDGVLFGSSGWLVTAKRSE